MCPRSLSCCQVLKAVAIDAALAAEADAVKELMVMFNNSRIALVIQVFRVQSTHASYAEASSRQRPY